MNPNSVFKLLKHENIGKDNDWIEIDEIENIPIIEEDAIEVEFVSEEEEDFDEDEDEEFDSDQIQEPDDDDNDNALFFNEENALNQTEVVFNPFDNETTVQEIVEENFNSFGKAEEENNNIIKDSMLMETSKIIIDLDDQDSVELDNNYSLMNDTTILTGAEQEENDDLNFEYPDDDEIIMDLTMNETILPKKEIK